MPAGTYTLQASLIGYATATRKRIAVGQKSVVVDFVLEEEPIELSSTIISASPIGEDVRRAPNRVNIVTREGIEQTPARNIQEVLQSVEGIFLARGEGISDTFPKIVMRGMTTGYLGRNSAVLTLLNGHTLNGSLGSWETIGDLDALPIALIQK
ncbi:MAG: TonB-dependent receptor plug domain-containing protein, partial [Planctomycetota bacterium]|nr:TonB-dependent receptor plug domain-containing protein [Planctomycetota bacterium]